MKERQAVRCFLIENGSVVVTKYNEENPKAGYYEIPGGKIEEKEYPRDTAIREFKEETGLTLKEYQLRGIVTYVSNKWETEYMYVFTATEFEGNLIECDEGDLEWIKKEKVNTLPTWEGDHIFVGKLQKDNGFFSGKFEYDGEKLVQYNLKEY